MTKPPPNSVAIIVPVLAAILAGGLTSVVVAVALKRRDAVPPRAECSGGSVETTSVREGGATNALVWNVVADLRARVSVLEERNGTTVSQEVGSAFPGSADEEKSKVQAAHDASIAKHRADSVDPAWGPQSSILLRTALEGLGKINHFSVSNVDCRNASCTADVRWVSLEEARRTYGYLLTGDYGELSCSAEILLPDRGEPEQPVEVTLVLNGCKRGKRIGL